MIEHMLRYNIDQEWRPLPGWAAFFIALGKFIANHPREGVRTVVGVATPTRAFAAAFAAAGATCGLGDNDVAADHIDHFDKLCQLPTLTAVTYLHGGRNKLGVILDCFEAGGERWLKVQTGHPHKNSETHGVNTKAAHKVQVIPELGVINPLDLPYNQYGTIISPPTPFTCQLLGEAAAHGFTVTSDMRALIVGHIKHLREEVVETPFSVIDENNSTPCAGNLQELTRVRRLYGLTNRPYRSDIFPSNSRRAPRNAQHPPPIVIFDGPNGFLRWREHWRRSHWLVILDMTHGNFPDSRETLNGEYITHRMNDDVPVTLPPPPEAVELVFYREKVNV